MKNSYRAVALSIAALSLAGYAALSLAGVKSSTPIQTVLHTFVGGTDGSNPVAGLIVDQQGALYGTTPNGGAVGGVCADGCGTVFKLTPPAPGQTAWTQTVLYTFCPEPNCSDGIAPNAGLIADQQGALYGTTQFGGTHDNGTVFKLTPPAPGQSEWPQAVLYAFCAESNCSDGFNPKAGLIADQQGALYGTTFNGGAVGGVCVDGCGTVFKLTPPAPGQTAWTQTVLYTFCSEPNCSDGFQPAAGLNFNPVDQQGALYGTTQLGGTGCVGNAVLTSGCGTVFKLTPPAPGQSEWPQTVLYSFCPQPNSPCSDGALPMASLIADQQGALYGTTQSGGIGCPGPIDGCGTVFKLTPPAPGESEWPQAVLYAFCAESNCSDGFNPKAGLIADQQGALYGTTFNGGAGFNQPQAGTVFKLTPPAEGQERWTQTVLHDFCSQLNGPYCSDGAQPAAGLAADQPGVLYGTTQYGGVSDGGTVFRVVF